MFGQDDQPAAQDTTIPDEAINNVMNDQGDGGQPASDVPQDPPVNDQAAPAPDPAAAPAVDDDWQHPGTPIEGPEPIRDVISPAGGFPKPPTFPKDNTVPANPPSDAPDDSTHYLIDIKQHALAELEPLVDELDQTPDEKFRTIMMMIQASDDQNLVSKAYEAAHQIEDEKTRAQALLDIVNEINYFTQPPQQPEQ